MVKRGGAEKGRRENREGSGLQGAERRGSRGTGAFCSGQNGEGQRKKERRAEAVLGRENRNLL